MAAAPMTAEQIVAALAALAPCTSSEIDGSPYCFFCGEWDLSKDGREGHEPDCLWLQAQEHEKGKGQCTPAAHS